MVLRFIYTLFIGIFLATFVGVGIAAFYTSPTFPNQPAILKYCSPEITQTATRYVEFKTQAEAFDKQVQIYQKASQIYNRNVSIIAVLAAIIIVLTSLTLFRKILLIADGLLLGGVLTLLYSVVQGFGTEDNMYRFLVVSIGFVTSLLLGYIKFVKKMEGGRNV